MSGARQHAEKTLLEWRSRVMDANNISGPELQDPAREKPVPIEMCPSTLARSNFAIAGMITSPRMGDSKQYQISAAKLAVSIKTWSPSLEVDMLLLIAVSHQDLARVDVELLAKSGWELCHVTVIESPPVKQRNRFLDADVFSRLLLWNLKEYRAVLSLDSDLVVSKDISKVFSYYYPLLMEKNMSLAATKDTLSPPCTNPSSVRETFNAGVMLIIPNTTMFSVLKHKVHSSDYDMDWAEQGLLNSVYTKGSYLELPFIYNAHMAEKRCNSTRWREIEDEIAIFHYTVVKGWDLKSMDFQSWYNAGAMDFSVFDAIFWDVLHFCYIWELIPVVYTPQLID